MLRKIAIAAILAYGVALLCGLTLLNRTEPKRDQKRGPFADEAEAGANYLADLEQFRQTLSDDEFDRRESKAVDDYLAWDIAALKDEPGPTLCRAYAIMIALDELKLSHPEQKRHRDRAVNILRDNWMGLSSDRTIGEPVPIGAILSR
jgi:hypothetical protein